MNQKICNATYLGQTCVNAFMKLVPGVIDNPEIGQSKSDNSTVNRQPSSNSVIITAL